MLRRSIGKVGKSYFRDWRICSGLRYYFGRMRPAILDLRRAGPVAPTLGHAGDFRCVPCIGILSFGGEPGPGGKRPNCCD